jgi:GntR family transcriptional regulator
LESIAMQTREPLDAISSTPLYQQIVEDIKQKIERGEYEYGMRIEGEGDLMKYYGVSRITVRRAVTELCSEGYLVKKQGLGTFVERPKIRRLISNVQSFSESCKQQGYKSSYRLNTLSIVRPQGEERAFLGLNESDQLIYSSRTLYADGVSIMLETCYFPLKPFSFLLQESLEQPLYPLLKGHNILPASTKRRTLEIQAASHEVARLLQVPIGEPLFYKIAHLADKEGKPLYIERSYIVGSRYIFDIK